ncbi:chemotaxis protein CheX [Tepidibacter formicigenes]|jgi:chemotaxis protein CheX|uniref:Chemotaxis protein CheX n=1 Tax=Tepidibacter formicigenes DSM 15518 TaxID=1123349 RepID=A0A1M6U926_9FIRM|nr:chemotaxis protein CheX [Tepidibacter formicigenes]SHK65687.1 chemotaxis protein CheX [Tepidibacter formicigenes DSM 15518]
MKKEYLNSILESTKSVIDMVCQEDIKKGAPYIKNNPYSMNDISVNIGITGELKGQFVLSLTEDAVKYIASQMMGGMEISDIEMGKSAIGELSNMIMGNAGTKLSELNKTIDITPPMIIEGKVSISNPHQTISLPFKTKNNMELEVNISIVEV